MRCSSHLCTAISSLPFTGVATWKRAFYAALKKSDLRGHDLYDAACAVACRAVIDKHPEIAAEGLIDGPRNVARAEIKLSKIAYDPSELQITLAQLSSFFDQIHVGDALVLTVHEVNGSGNDAIFYDVPWTKSVASVLKRANLPADESVGVSVHSKKSEAEFVDLDVHDYTPPMPLYIATKDLLVGHIINSFVAQNCSDDHDYSIMISIDYGDDDCDESVDDSGDTAQARGTKRPTDEDAEVSDAKKRV